LKGEKVKGGIVEKRKAQYDDFYRNRFLFLTL